MTEIKKNLQKITEESVLMAAMAAAILLASPIYAADEHSGHDGHGGSAATGCSNCTNSVQAHSGNHDQVMVVAGEPYMLKMDPVSGQELGQNPIITSVHGREIRFANEESLAKFNDNPEIYLHAVDQMMIKQQTPLYPLDTCVISGEKLGGSMGDPVDFIYGNRLVRFCCKMCKKEFLKDPADYLKTIDKVAIAEQLPLYPLSTCVVSGEKLGGEMGEPVEYVVGNQLVRLCCKGCIKQFNEKPLVYLGKLNEAKKQNAGQAGGHGVHGHAQH